MFAQLSLLTTVDIDSSSNFVSKEFETSKEWNKTSNLCSISLSKWLEIIIKSNMSKLLYCSIDSEDKPSHFVVYFTPFQPLFTVKAGSLKIWTCLTFRLF